MSLYINEYDCNWTRSHNHFVHKQTLNHLTNHLAVYELSGCGFESSCSHITFKQGVPRHSGNYRV